MAGFFAVPVTCAQSTGAHSVFVPPLASSQPVTVHHAHHHDHRSSAALTAVDRAEDDSGETSAMPEFSNQLPETADSLTTLVATAPPAAELEAAVQQDRLNRPGQDITPVGLSPRPQAPPPRSADPLR